MPRPVGPCHWIAVTITARRPPSNASPSCQELANGRPITSLCERYAGLTPSPKRISPCATILGELPPNRPKKCRRHGGPGAVMLFSISGKTQVRLRLNDENVEGGIHRHGSKILVENGPDRPR